MCNNSSCGCNFNRCTNLGPFVAVDADCILPPVNGFGSVIAFSSGITPFTLTDAAGLVSSTAYIGFGSNVASATLAGVPIVLTAVFNEAFSVPRAGTLTSIAASFIASEVVVVAPPATDTATVNATIYHAPAGTTTFSPTPVSVNLAPPLTNGLAAGTTVFGTASGFAFPVAPGDRLLMVFSTFGSSAATTSTVVGTATAGLTIE